MIKEVSNGQIDHWTTFFFTFQSFQQVQIPLESGSIVAIFHIVMIRK